MPITDIYNLAMNNLATHYVKKALVYLVIYIHMTGSDLSEELLELADNPDSLQTCVDTSRALEASEDNRIDLGMLKHSKEHSKGSKNASESISSMSNEIMHAMNKYSLSGINAVLVDNNYNIYRYHCNDLSSLPQADLGLDLIKDDLMRKANGASRNFGHSNKPNNPSHHSNDDGMTIHFVQI